MPHQADLDFTDDLIPLGAALIAGIARTYLSED